MTQKSQSEKYAHDSEKTVQQTLGGIAKIYKRIAMYRTNNVPSHKQARRLTQ